MNTNKQMKPRIITSAQFADYVNFVPANTFFLCINHKYDTFKRYTLYKTNGMYCEKCLDTNSKEEVKIWMDLRGNKIIRKFLIGVWKGIDNLENKIKYGMFELNKV